MSDFSTVVLLIAVTSLSLFFVSVANKRQVRAQVVHQKVNQMKRRVSELEELSVTLEPLIETNEVSILINDEIIDILHTMIKLSPKETFFQVNLESAEKRSEDLCDPASKPELFRMMESDASIARSEYSLTEAARIVRKRQANEKIPTGKMEQLLVELNWSNFMVKVITNIGQGHQATNNGNAMKASAYYRKALELISERPQTDERINQLVKEVDKILGGKRKALSLSLMPESLHNPEEAAPNQE